MMPPDDELDELERTLDPMARFVISHLRKDNALLREQLEKNGELIQRLTEQVEALNRRLFGKRSEKIPTVREKLCNQPVPDELTVDGTPMPEEPEARAKEKLRGTYSWPRVYGSHDLRAPWCRQNNACPPAR